MSKTLFTVYTNEPLKYTQNNKKLKQNNSILVEKMMQNIVYQLYYDNRYTD